MAAALLACSAAPPPFLRHLGLAAALLEAEQLKFFKNYTFVKQYKQYRDCRAKSNCCRVVVVVAFESGADVDDIFLLNISSNKQ
jgi:hypothetical protein